MQVKIITNKKDKNYDVEVVQKNKNPIQFKPFCEYDKKSNTILVSVPSSEANAVSQIGTDAWKWFVSAYVSSINKAIETKKMVILVPELGLGLLWKDCLMPMAAREALDMVKKCSDGFTVIFCVNDKRYKLWDEMMVFD